MMKTHVLMHPRAEELLVERAVRPLTEAELAELAALGIGPDDEGLELAAAALALAATPMHAMPPDVMARVAAATIPAPGAGAASPIDFRTTLPGVLPPRPPVVEGPRVEASVAVPAPAGTVVPIEAARAKRRRGWVIGAAALAAGVAIGLGVMMLVGAAAGGEPVPPTAGRAALLASAGDARPLAWTATADAAARGARGDVVWSAAKQQGYMRFVGLAVNDPKAWQYQLWIFDRARDQAFPVDGGVFDVGAAGEVVVPIAAKLHVDDATLFAVTIERPGGVVVSKRERIVVTAKPG